MVEYLHSVHFLGKRLAMLAKVVHNLTDVMIFTVVVRMKLCSYKIFELIKQKFLFLCLI